MIQYLNDPDNAEWEPGYTWETELEKDFAVVFLLYVLVMQRDYQYSLVLSVRLVSKMVTGI